MTDETWTPPGAAAAPMTRGAEDAPKKSGMPKWLWFCGGGCLLAIMTAALAGFLLFQTFSNAKDPDVQWPAVEAVLPFDERPDVVIATIPMRLGGVKMWFLVDAPKRVNAVLFHVDQAKDEEFREQQFDPDMEIDLGGMMRNYGRHEVEPGTILVQGRELQCLRYQTLPKEGAEESGGSSWFDEAFDELEGASILVDVTPEGREDSVFLQYTRQRSSDRISDEEIAGFLAPFHVGPDR